MPLILYSFVACGGALIIVAVLQRRRRAANLPPGPPGDPFIGHLLRMPSTDSALVFHQWAKTYGPVMHLKILGQSMIILDSYQAALDLLDKKGLIYSDRPKFTLYKLLGWDPSLTLVSYGSKSQSIQRQMHQSYLSRHKVGDFKLMQTEEARRLVQKLMESPPKQYAKLMSRFIIGMISQIVAGHRITSDDDPYIRISQMINESVSKLGPPGSSPLDLFPFPNSGEAMPSFIREQLEQMDEREDEEELKGAAVTMFSAGDSTTWTTLTIFVLAMTLHPEAQAKAQKEIDSVVGHMRLPEFRDREDLPFVEGILQETLRWIPAVPLGQLRRYNRITQLMLWKGCLIAQGRMTCTVVCSFQRGLSYLQTYGKAIGLDESVYSDPTSFRPERFLPRPAGAGEPHFSNVAFGFGRRICTGQYVADQILWIAITSILATCTITKAVDENGNIIVPDITMSDGLVSHPNVNDFRCVISPRSPEAKALIQIFNSS
ncbi:O-methylsterigmatocystin oxidoreductase [Mycena sanguinolenta]|uniref:O-methylsterigmatocystin oxidoreductase n=1 Tax=Mycena sanguinolenta TaxID=230812 RepID=A0A8H6XM31_9AGAR|nr:O-methylsterigmatocystin oxidoreductase [Mycena sanguinolenta]